MHVAKFQFWTSGEWTIPAHQIISRSERFKVEENIRTDFVNRISALVNVGEVFNRIIVFKRMLTEYSKLVENMSFSLAHILRETFKSNIMLQAHVLFKRYYVEMFKQNISFAFKKTILASFMEKVKIDKRINFVFIKRLTDAKSIASKLIPIKLFKFKEIFTLKEKYILVFYSVIVEATRLFDSIRKTVKMIRRESFEIREIFSTAKYLFAILLMRNVILSKTMKFTVKIPEKTHILVNNIIRYLLLILGMEKKKE
jgi:hypothetical protein